MKYELDKEMEIREYSVRENIFIAAVVAANMKDLFHNIPKEEVMATVIELAEQFANEHPEGTTEQLEQYARIRLNKLLSK